MRATVNEHARISQSGGRPVSRRRFAAQAFALLVGLLLVTAVPSGAQEQLPASSSAAEFAPSSEQADKLAEARVRWAEMDATERRQVVARFEQWRALEPHVREQVRKNYRRLQASYLDQQGEGSTAGDEIAPQRRGAPEARRHLSPKLLRRIEHVADNPVIRHRLRTLDAELGPQLRHDRELLRELRRVPRHQRRELLEEARQQARLERIDRALQTVGADSEQAVAVHAILDEQHERKARLLEELGEQRRDMRQEAAQRLVEIMGEEHAEFARRLLGPMRIAPAQRPQHRHRPHRREDPR